MPYLETRIKHRDVSRALTVKMFPPPEDNLRTTQAEYRYEFRGAPRQKNDEVIQMMTKVSQFLNKRHIVFAAADVWPHAFDTDPPLWPCPAKGAKDKRKLYAFTQAFEEFPLAAEILIPRGTKELNVDKTLVRNKRPNTTKEELAWTPLIHWLLPLPDVHLLTMGQNRHGVPRILHWQQIWWSKTGKKFPLLSLLAELRALIFKHALGKNIYPDICYSQTLGVQEVTLGSRQQHLPPYSALRTDAPNYNILGLSKSTREEALKEGTWRHFAAHSDLTTVLDPSVVPPNYTWLSRLQLDYTFSGYFYFFGVSIDPNVHLTTSPPKAALIPVINDLRHLGLHFKSPYEASRQDNSWYAFRSRNTMLLHDPRFR
jgi:hypothetical protein